MNPKMIEANLSISLSETEGNNGRKYGRPMHSIMAIAYPARLNSTANHLNIVFTNSVFTAEVPIPGIAGITGIPGIPSQNHRQAHIVHFAFAETAGASGIHFPANTELMENNEH